MTQLFVLCDATMCFENAIWGMEISLNAYIETLLCVFGYARVMRMVKLQRVVCLVRMAMVCRQHLGVFYNAYFFGFQKGS